MNIKLLKDLNFADKLNTNEPVTEAGKDMIKSYRGFLYSNPVTCGVVNGFVQEAQKFSFDTGMMGILESVLNFINKNKISWKLASVCESIQNNPSTYNYIAKISVDKVENLLAMNENEVVSYIKAGALKGVQYIPEFRAICKEIYKTTVCEMQTPNYTISNPISYVLISEGTQYFNVLGKTFEIKENKVSESKLNNKEFTRINLLLESFKKNENSIVYECKVGFDNISYSIADNTLNFTKGNSVSESFEDVISFRQYCDTLSRTMRVNERMQFMNISNAIAEVFECVDNIVVLDCVKLLNTANGTILAITEAKENVNMTVFRSIGAGTSSNDYDFVIEALNDVTKLTGIDLKHVYEERIDEDCKKQNPEEYKAIKEELEANKTAQMDIRKKKIAMLAEKYKNDPARIALLNKTARELSILEK